MPRIIIGWYVYFAKRDKNKGFLPCYRTKRHSEYESKEQAKLVMDKLNDKLWNRHKSFANCYYSIDAIYWSGHIHSPNH